MKITHLFLFKRVQKIIKTKIVENTPNALFENVFREYMIEDSKGYVVLWKVRKRIYFHRFEELLSKFLNNITNIINDECEKGYNIIRDSRLDFVWNPDLDIEKIEIRFTWYSGKPYSNNK